MHWFDQPSQLVSVPLWHRSPSIAAPIVTASKMHCNSTVCMRFEPATHRSDARRVAIDVSKCKGRDPPTGRTSADVHTRQQHSRRGREQS